jgi:putative intracellular protease/amidase
MTDNPFSLEKLKMKHVSLILALVVTMLLIGCASQQSVSAQQSVPKKGGKVLIILSERKGVSGSQYMDDEAIIMKNILDEAGFKVEMASVSGQNYHHRSGTLYKSISKLSDLKTDDYVGFVFPCMRKGQNIVVLPEEASLAKRAAAEGKPIAAQHKGVVVLAEAGILSGRRYSFWSENNYEVIHQRFFGAIYGGKSVVRDGNIITSSYCPHWGYLDQTAELITAFIAELQK